MFLRAIKKLTAENPCLLSLLEIQYYDDDPDVQMLSCRKQERSSQTAVHVLDGFRDPEYRWNEWDMRKEALKMSHARTATTKSVQTEVDLAKWLSSPAAAAAAVSGRKLPVGVQVSIPTARAVQAGRNDVSTSTGQTRSLILGLQGETSFPVQHLILDELSCNT